MDFRMDNQSEGNFFPRLPVLLFFNSAFAVSYAGFLLREISVRTYGTELTCLVPGILFLLFAACGGVFGRCFRKLEASSLAAFAAPLPVLAASILLPELLPQFSMTRRNILFAMPILLLLSLPLFLSGLNFWLALRTVLFRRTVVLFAVNGCGAAVPGILFTVLIHSFENTLLLLLLSGLFLLLSGLFFYLPRLKRSFVRGLFPVFTLATGVLLFYVNSGFLERRLFQADPLRGGADAVRLDTAYGRSELLRTPEKRFLFISNGQRVSALPGNPERDRLAVLMSGIQPDRKRIRVLLICGAFSGFPEAFASLPLTASLDLVIRDRKAAALATELDLLPPESPSFRLILDDPVHFVDRTFHTYDVIFVDPPLPQNLDAARFFSHEFYRDASKRLADDGVFVTTLPAPYGYTRESIAELHGIIAATMREVFPNVIFAPGAIQLAMGGGRNLTSDLDTLDARAAALMGENDSFPEGLLVILHSQAEQLAQAQKIIGRSIVSESNRRFEASLLLNYWRRHPVFTDVAVTACLLRMLDFLLFYRCPLIGGALLLYLLARYFASVTVTRKCLFASLENGFFLGGLFTLSMILFQSAYGTLYQMLGLYGGILCCGIAGGILLAERFRVPGICLKIFSFFLPALLASVLLSEGIPLFPLTESVILFSGASGGIVLHELTGRCNDGAVVPLWSAELAGAVIGMALTAFFMIVGNGFLFCIGLLMVSRITCLFHPSAQDPH